MRAKLAILLLAIALGVPTAMGAWGVKGSLEPDTKQDRLEGWMWPNADITPQSANVNKLYLNGFTSQSLGFHAEVGSSLNPNFATVQSGRQSWNGRVVAMMGVWKDCNRDGYVGFGDNGIFEYRSELLQNTFGTSICPPMSTGAVPAGGASHTWAGSKIHNDGTWVREWIAIGPTQTKTTLQDANPYNFADNGARVWADWNAAGDLPPPNRCYAFAPDQSFHTTGGMLAYVDCFASFIVTDTWTQAAVAGGLDNAGLGQLSFKDKPRDTGNSASVLNQKHPWGNEAGPSMVTAFDCENPVAQATPVEGRPVRIPAPQTPSQNPAGTIGGTVNATENGFEDCDNSDGGTWDLSGVAYAGENPGLTNTPGAKQQTDFVLDYNEGKRPSTGVSTLGPSTSKDAGVRATETEGFYLGTTVIGEDRNPFVDRADVRSQNAFNGVQYITTYGYISDDAKAHYGITTNPTNKVGIYGSDNCGVNAGVNNAPDAKGWHCAPNLWWPGGCQSPSCRGTINGNSGVDINIYVGKTYVLRDIDCYDTSVGPARDAGVTWGTLTSTACIK